MRTKRHKARTPRSVAAEVITRVLYDHAFAGAVLQKHPQLAQMSPQDRGFCVELVYGTLRWKEVLEDGIRAAARRPNQKIHKSIRSHLLVAVYQLQFLGDRVPKRAAINEAVESVKQVRRELSGFTNGLLRNIKDPHYLSLTGQEDLSVLAKAFGIPLSLAEATSRGLPKSDWRAALMALNGRPETGLTYLGLQSERHKFEERLQQKTIRYRLHDFVSNAYLLEKPGHIPELPFFAEGQIQVQDPGSLLAAQLLNPATGDRVLDMCAAPGGKTMVLAKAVGAEGETIASELHEARAQKIRENAQRMKVQVDIAVGDARKLLSHTQKPFDGILLDAPCSGLGTTRRKPEVKWKDTTQGEENLTGIQRALLQSAAANLKAGGTLVYSVCSPMPSEGASIIEQFLDDHPDFQREDPRSILPNLPSSALDQDNNIQLRTFQHETDAFFMARLKKNDS